MNDAKCSLLNPLQKKLLINEYASDLLNLVRKEYLRCDCQLFLYFQNALKSHNTKRKPSL